MENITPEEAGAELRRTLNAERVNWRRARVLTDRFERSGNPDDRAEARRLRRYVERHRPQGGPDGYWYDKYVEEHTR